MASSAWDLLSVLFLNYVVWLVPLRVFFDVGVDTFSAAWFIELTVDIFFLLGAPSCFLL